MKFSNENRFIGQMKMVEFLITNGINLNVPNNENETALHVAVLAGKLRFFKENYNLIKSELTVLCLIIL